MINLQISEDVPLFPIKVFVFNKDGTHNGPMLIIENDEQLNSIGFKIFLKIHIDTKFEVMLTDPGDLCLFHAKDGVLLFPTQEDVKETKNASSK